MCSVLAAGTTHARRHCSSPAVLALSHHEPHDPPRPPGRGRRPSRPSLPFTLASPAHGLQRRARLGDRRRHGPCTQAVTLPDCDLGYNLGALPSPRRTALSGGQGWWKPGQDRSSCGSRPQSVGTAASPQHVRGSLARGWRRRRGSEFLAVLTPGRRPGLPARGPAPLQAAPLSSLLLPPPSPPEWSPEPGCPATAPPRVCCSVGPRPTLPAWRRAVHVQSALKARSNRQVLTHSPRAPGDINRLQWPPVLTHGPALSRAPP